MLIPLAFAFSILLQKSAIAVEAPQQPPAHKPWVAPFKPMPHAPRLPKVDVNSCPFEGCQFGKWTARKIVQVFSTWQPNRKPIATLAKGDEVTAITGVNVVLQPGNGMFDRDVPAFGALKGDTAFMYQNCGEGAVDLWVHGRFIHCAEPNFSWNSEEGCQKDCDGRWLSLGKSEWWAQVRMQNGTTGWVLVEGNFDGTDALAFLFDGVPYA